MTETSGTISSAEFEHQALRLESEQRFEDARDAFDAALNLDPSSRTIAEGRARVALALREIDAVTHCSRALAFHNDHPERQLRMISTTASALGGAAIPLFEEYVGRHPQNAEAHELLAELRSEVGSSDYTEGFLSALRAYPENKPLLMSYWNTLTRAGRLLEALESMDSKRALFEDDRDFTMLEIAIANHSGQIDRSGKLLDMLDNRPDAQLARGMHRLQSNQPDEAAKYLSTVIAGQFDNLEAWALLELAWRITGDHRHEWLVGQPGLYGPCQLDISASQLDEIATFLRSQHHAKAQPIGQSLRGGTQTPGQLLLRHEPEIKLLHDALAETIRDFVGKLPDADPRHPLLNYRDMGLAFGPSWSVRFTGSGYHAAHFHPGGILSSACYIAVPETVVGNEEQQGWLEIGRPPPELGLDLEPLATFEPKPGRLVLFPSFLFHGTRPFSGGERLSVAFDLVPVPMS